MRRALVVALLYISTILQVAAAQPRWPIDFQSDRRMHPNPFLDALGSHESKPAWEWAGLAYYNLTESLGEHCHHYPTAPIDARLASVTVSQIEGTLSRWARVKTLEVEGISLRVHALPDGHQLVLAYQPDDSGLLVLSCVTCQGAAGVACNRSPCAGFDRSILTYERAPYWTALKTNLDTALASCQSEYKRRAAERQREQQLQQQREALKASEDAQPQQERGRLGSAPVYVGGSSGGGYGGGVHRAGSGKSRGYYVGGSGSSHKGGRYVNPSTGNRYRKRR